MSEPYISVVIAAYNRGGLISLAIQSVLKQTRGDFELIVVDDASEDNTSEVVQSIKDDRIRLIRNKTNVGAGNSRNIGIQAANGKYIAFLDSDDEWMENKLEKQIAIMQSDPEKYPLSFTGFYVLRQNSAKKLLRSPKKYGTWLESLLYGETFSLGSTLVAEKACFEKVGLFDTRLKRLEDNDWCIRYFDYYESFIVIPEPLACIHNTGWPSVTVVEKSIVALFEANKERLIKHKKQYAILFEASLCFEAAVTHYRCGQTWMAIRKVVYILYKQPGFLAYMAYRIMRKLKERDWI